MPPLTAQDRDDIRAEHYPKPPPLGGTCECGTRYPCTTIELLDMLDAAEAKVKLMQALIAAVPCSHEWVYVEDEYGSLADGGSYEVYKCAHCDRKSYVQMAD